MDTQTVKETTTLCHETDYDVALTYKQYGIPVTFTNRGDEDCPDCGHTHEEYDIVQINVGGVTINYCPCGYIWLGHPATGRQIPLANHLVVAALCNSHRDDSQRDKVPHLRALLRTRPGHALSFDGGHSHLFYHPPGKSWVVDTPAITVRYMSFDKAWQAYNLPYQKGDTK